MLNLGTKLCNRDCQSNSVVHPKTPGSKGGDALNRGEKRFDDDKWPKPLTISAVVEYWEAWNARYSCHNTQAADLPTKSLDVTRRSLCSYLVMVEALTHLNYAFAYIDSKSFEIITKDARTRIITFQNAVGLKYSSQTSNSLSALVAGPSLTTGPLLNLYLEISPAYQPFKRSLRICC